MLTQWFPGLLNPYYRRYAAISGCVLLAIGAILALLRATKHWNASGVQKTWVAYQSWLIMLPLAFLVLGLGREAFIFGVGVLSIAIVKEFALATGLYRDWAFMIAVYAGIGGLFWAVVINWYGLFVAMPVYGIVLLFMIPLLRNEYEGMIQRVGLSTIALIYLGWFLAHLAFLANHPQWYAYVPFLILGTEFNDVAAFLTGKFFGKHPFISKISPNKTVEGTVGSLALISAYVWVLRSWLPGFNAPLLLLTVAILWIGGTFGDLVISMVKRDIGIKDMGRLIPGHGGVLDRVDSLLFTSPLFFHMVNHYVR